jgi:hypothetical protein
MKNEWGSACETSVFKKCFRLAVVFGGQKMLVSSVAHEQAGRADFLTLGVR